MTVPEAELKSTDAGLIPQGEGWFVLNARDASWIRSEERERPVGVMELLARPPVVREEQQPEPNLGDEQRLAQRQDVREDAPGRLAAEVHESARKSGEDGHAQHEECKCVVGR